jgi:hypothetical protein
VITSDVVGDGWYGSATGPGGSVAQSGPPPGTPVVSDPVPPGGIPPDPSLVPDYGGNPFVPNPNLQGGVPPLPDLRRTTPMAPMPYASPTHYGALAVVAIAALALHFVK